MEQTELDIGTVGQRLGAGRQAKGVSVSEAAAQTRILVKYISAMEADNFSVLSAPVYAKSFIRLYANYLELEAAPLVADYERGIEGSSAAKLTDDVRETLVKADVPPSESVSVGSGGAQALLGSVREITRLSSRVRFTGRQKGLAVVLVVAVVLGLVGVRQCSDESEPEGVPGAVSLVELPTIEQPFPDLYLDASGSIEWER
tara:strand:- start:9027 stop:9632 length:606 start_codon:yes stop_codon:yes gene_type:complete